MRDEELRKLHAGSRCAPARSRGPPDRLDPAPDHLPDGILGLTYLMQGWLAGTEGFSQTRTIAIVLAEVLDVVWMTWLLVVAWRMPDSEAASPRQ